MGKIPLVRNNGSQEFVITEGQNMLVLSRKHGEAIVIGDGITVTVLAVDGDRVKLGVAAPAEVSIHREEIYQKIGRCSPPSLRRVCVGREKRAAFPSIDDQDDDQDYGVSYHVDFHNY